MALYNGPLAHFEPIYPDTRAYVSSPDGPLAHFGPMCPAWMAHWPTLGPCIQIRGPLYPAWPAPWPTLGPRIQICDPMYPVWTVHWPTLGPCISALNCLNLGTVPPHPWQPGRCLHKSIRAFRPGARPHESTHVGLAPPHLHASMWMRVGIPRAYMRPYGCV